MARLILEGDAVSFGIGIGNVAFSEERIKDEKRKISEQQIGEELAAITFASESVCKSLIKKLAEIPESHEEYRDILLTQLELARDAKILDGARARVVKRKICASWALSETIDELAALFDNLPDALEQDSAKDIQAIGKCLLAALCASGSNPSSQPVVLAVKELTPTDILNLKDSNIRAIISVEGGATTHAIILARSLKIPVICGLNNLFSLVAQGEQIIVDGFGGKVLLDPSRAELEKYRQTESGFLRLEEIIAAKAHIPASTLDGEKITVMANMETPGQSRQLKSCGAEGIGLYRTEFSYLDKGLPTEESLFQEYRIILKNIGKKPVVFRTLDVGADKILPANLRLHEDNPALGLRGIRFCLQYRDIFTTQLRALLRACHNANASLMLPMLTSLEELEQTRELVAKIETALEREGKPCKKDFPLGIMVETPAAAIIADELVRHCDFISIGTNDLIHYLLAIDRGNRHVAALHDPLHPAFLRTLKNLVEQAGKYGKPVSVCGELASDPQGIILLLGVGIRILSATPRFVPALKHFISLVRHAECRKIMNDAVNSFTPGKIQKELNEMLASLGFGANATLFENLAYAPLEADARRKGALKRSA